MADTEGEQHARERLRLGTDELVRHLAGDGVTDLDGVTRGHALLLVVLGVGSARVERSDGVGIERVEIGDIAQQTRLDHFVDELVAQAVHVHAATAHPVDEALLELRGAIEGHAAVRHLVTLVHHGTAAGGASLGHIPLDRVGGALVQHRTNDLRDHVAGLVDDDGIAHAHILAADLVEVVQSCAGDGGTGHRDGVELGNRGEHAGAPHLDANLTQNGGLLLRRELEGDGPARCAGGEAEIGLLVEPIDLHNHTVDVVIQVSAMRERIGAEGVNLLGRGAACHGCVDGKARLAQPVEERMLGVHMQGRRVGDRVDEGGKAARRGDLGVLLAQAARGGVAGVGKGLATLGVGLRIQTSEAALGHVDLTTDLDGSSAVSPHVGQRGLGEVHGHVFDGAHVERNVLARRTIAARGGAHERTVLIGDGHAEAVDLELTGVGNAPRAERLLRTDEPLVELLEIHGVVHGIHARHMRDRRELLRHVAAHALGVGAGGDELGMGRLDLLKLGQQLVESSVRDLGRIEGVVAIGVVIEQVAQLGRARCRLSADVLRGLGSRRSAIRLNTAIRRHIAKQALLLRHVGLPDSQISTTTEYHRARMLSLLRIPITE